jgi:hypothetical protein
VQRRRLFFKIPFICLVHVSETRPHRIEGFEWTDKGAGRKNVDFDAPATNNLDRSREAHCTGLKSRQAFRPVGDHLQAPDSLRDCWHREI